MMAYALVLLIVALVASSVSAFKSSSRVTLKPVVSMKISTSDVFKSTAFAIATSPFVAHADDGATTAVAIPLAISVLIMVPFLYYQQALRPKAKVVQQLELDEKGRPTGRRQTKSNKK